MTNLAIWALASVGFQARLRAVARSGWVRPAWLATDLILLTAILRVLDASGSALVVGYPLLVAASGLWFRVRLVWFTTLLAELFYGALTLDASARGVLSGKDQWPNIFMAALAVTGFIVAHQVRRIRALSSYYEQRPVS